MERQAKIIGMTNEEIHFLIPSSRNGYHNVTYNRCTDTWTCTCEHYHYRVAYCKHMEQAKELLVDIVEKAIISKNIINPYNETIKMAEAEEY